MALDSYANCDLKVSFLRFAELDKWFQRGFQKENVKSTLLSVTESEESSNRFNSCPSACYLVYGNPIELSSLNSFSTLTLKGKNKQLLLVSSLKSTTHYSLFIIFRVY